MLLKYYFQLGVALAKLFFLAEHEGLGLFLVTCVPGGGAGHLLVSIIGADRSLSISINCANIFLAVGKSTLFVLHNSFPRCCAACMQMSMYRGGNFIYDQFFQTTIDKVYICIKFVSLYVLYEIMWNTCVTLIYSFIMYILICTSRNLLQCCTSNSNVVQCRAELLVV